MSASPPNSPGPQNPQNQQVTGQLPPQIPEMSTPIAALKSSNPNSQMQGSGGAAPPPPQPGSVGMPGGMGSPLHNSLQPPQNMFPTHTNPNSLGQYPYPYAFQNGPHGMIPNQQPETRKQNGMIGLDANQIDSLSFFILFTALFFQAFCHL